MLDALSQRRRGTRPLGGAHAPRLPNDGPAVAGGLGGVAAHASVRRAGEPIEIGTPPAGLSWNVWAETSARRAAYPPARTGPSTVGAFRAERALGILVPDTRPWYVAVTAGRAVHVVTLPPGELRALDVPARGAASDAGRPVYRPGAGGAAARPSARREGDRRLPRQDATDRGRPRPLRQPPRA